MAAKPVQLRDRAAADLDSPANHYRSEADVAVAVRFIDAVERTTQRIGRNPHLGTLRFAYELEIPELRSMPVDRFPCLVLYIELDDYVNVWRILHTRRDIPSAPFQRP